MDEKRLLFKQILAAKYIARFLGIGIKRLQFSRHLQFCMVLGFLAAWTLGQAVVRIAVTGSPLAGMLESIYSVVLGLLCVCAGVVLLYCLGAPRDFLAVCSGLTKISLTNAAGEIPILLSRAPVGHGRGERWEFESYGVPLSEFNDNAEEIESALDVALVASDTGSNGRRVVLTVVPHPGPWPKLLPWDVSKCPEKPSMVVLGENRGEPVFYDFGVMPHLLVAGTSGSGKTVLFKSIILQLLAKGAQAILIDFKLGADYSEAWQNRCTFIMKDDEMVEILETVHAEMTRRLTLFRGIRNIEVYNSICTSQEKLNRIVVCFDEVGEALEKESGMSKEQKAYKDRASYLLSSIARLGRAAGVHLLLATQRGSAEVLSGQIRSNIRAVCGIANENLSILTLGNANASKRIPKTAVGRFLLDDDVTVFQGFYSEFEEEDFRRAGCTIPCQYIDFKR